MPRMAAPGDHTNLTGQFFRVDAIDRASSVKDSGGVMHAALVLSRPSTDRKSLCDIAGAA